MIRKVHEQNGTARVLMFFFFRCALLRPPVHILMACRLIIVLALIAVAFACDPLKQAERFIAALNTGQNLNQTLNEYLASNFTWQIQDASKKLEAVAGPLIYTGYFLPSLLSLNLAYLPYQNSCIRCCA